jgi:dihydrofolate reductase
MRKLTAAVFVSLDGIMQAPGGPEEDPSGGFKFGGWTFPFADESMQAPFAKFLVEPDYDLLLGKRTYEIFAAYWPYNQDVPIGTKFQRINKYVLTHSKAPLTWENSIRLSGDTAASVEELKNSEGRDLLIQGSSTLYPPLLSARLIDQLIMITYPVLLGSGKSIFDGPVRPGRMKLVDRFESDSGVIFRTYQPAGDVPTGSYATKEPSAAELDRRAKVEAGAW